jgi:DNA-binding transcriptional MerR regulator
MTDNEFLENDSAFKTIGEVSEELDIPPHVLRFWEGKFSSVKPLKRRGGHRYYRPADVESLKEIRALLYEKGFTIKGAQKHLKANKDEVVTEYTPPQKNLFEEKTKINSEKNNNLDINKNITNIKFWIKELTEVRELLENV